MSYFDDQVAGVKNDPRYSVADVQAAESFKINGENIYKRRVKEFAGSRKSNNSTKRDALYQEVRSVQREIDAMRDEADKGTTPHTDLMARRRGSLHRLGEIERRFEALENSEALIAAMESDPVSWMDSFYEKWTGLQHQRPRLDEFLAEDRERRRRR